MLDKKIFQRAEFEAITMGFKGRMERIGIDFANELIISNSRRHIIYSLASITF